MLNFIKILGLIGPTLLGATLGVSGSWSSAGGDLVKHAHNPWFMKNTSTVSYCIKVNHKTFDHDEDTLNGFIQAGLKYWRKELKKSLVSDYDPNAQTYQRQTKCLDADVVFQFGVLTEKQRKYLGDPRDHVGVTVRTDYDETTLRAKGFVYFSPDNGPESFVKNSENVVKDPWSFADGHLLFLTILHELGHILGFSHDGRYWSLMSVQFVENSLSPKIAHSIGSGKYVPKFFEYEGSNESIYRSDDPFLTPITFSYFGVPEGWRWLKIKREFELIETWSRKSAADEWVPLGKSHFERKEIATMFPTQHAYINTEIQTVFESPRGNYLQGPSRISYRFVGSYKTHDEKVSHQLFADYLTTGPTFGGVYNGKIYPNLTPIPLSAIASPEARGINSGSD